MTAETRSTRGTSCPLLALALSIAAAPAAATTNWIEPGVGDWFDPANWDGGVPDVSNSAWIDNGGTAEIASPGAIGGIAIGSPEGGVGTLVVRDGGTLVSFGSLGTAGEGTLVVDGAGSRAELLGGDFYVARMGRGILVVKNGGVVDCDVEGGGDTLLRTADISSGFATIAIGGGPDEPPAAPGFLDAPFLIAGTGNFSTSGYTEFLFNHTSPEYYLTDDGTATGDGISITGHKIAFEHTGPGTTILPHAYAPTTWWAEVDAGTLVVDGGSFPPYGGGRVAVATDPGEVATLVIRNGGVLDSGFVSIGTAHPNPGIAHGTAIVEGEGSLLAGRASNLNIGGGGGTGRLVLADGGMAATEVEAIILVKGTLEIGQGGAPGVANTPGISTSGATAILFDHTAAGYHFTRTGAAGGAAVPIDGTGEVQHLGPGTTFLPGSHSYTGATTVAAGTLVVSGSIVASAVSVADGATIGGDGTVGTLTVESGGILAPGASVGTLTTGNLTLSPGALLRFELGAPGNGDRVIVNGDLALGGALEVADAGGFAAGEYTLLTYTGSLSGSGLVLAGLPDGFDPADWELRAGAGSVTLLPLTPPQVVAIETLAGNLPECATTTSPVAALRVRFDEAMANPAGHTDAADVTNPANYLLVQPGANGDYDTFVCGGATGDDLVIPATAVTWDAGAFTATVGYSQALPRSPYQLLVCATLEDLQGLPLDGTGDGVGGDDFARLFRVDTDNAMVNAHFDCGLEGWNQVLGSFEHASIDEGSLSVSGSASTVLGTGQPFGEQQLFGLQQCGAVTPGRPYEIGTRVRLDIPGPELVTVLRDCLFYVTCGGASVPPIVSDQEVHGDTDGEWISLARTVAVPDGANAVLCTFGLSVGAKTVFDAYFDDLSVRFESAIFADGFESGGTGD